MGLFFLIVGILSTAVVLGGARVWYVLDREERTARSEAAEYEAYCQQRRTSGVWLPPSPRHARPHSPDSGLDPWASAEFLDAWIAAQLPDVEAIADRYRLPPMEQTWQDPRPALIVMIAAYRSDIDEMLRSSHAVLQCA